MIAGPCFFAPGYDPLAPLLYVNFNSNDARDESPDPVAPTILGPAPSFTGGDFVPALTNGIYSQVSWSGAKFDVIQGAAFTLECEVSWTSLPNATINEIIRIQSPSSIARLFFYLNNGQLRGPGTGVDQTLVTLPGTTKHHLALQFDGNSSGSTSCSIYAAGARVFFGTLNPLGVPPYTVTIGKFPASQAPIAYRIDNVRLTPRQLYSGATITPPTFA